MRLIVAWDPPTTPKHASAQRLSRRLLSVLHTSGIQFSIKIQSNCIIWFLCFLLFQCCFRVHWLVSLYVKHSCVRCRRVYVARGGAVVTSMLTIPWDRHRCPDALKAHSSPVWTCRHAASSCSWLILQFLLVSSAHEKEKALRVGGGDIPTGGLG